jgi:cobaltochelatase CobS
MPSVLSVYQPVLEGKPLLIKDAPHDQRVIVPHPNFRFLATGNTNGGGDETGLYQGTQIQNAANYSRFGIVIEIRYMEEKLEMAVVSSQSDCTTEQAGKVVRFANDVRDAFRGNRISSTISPRELITIAKLARARGDMWRYAVEVGFLNRLSRIDKEVVGQFSQRVFG